MWYLNQVQYVKSQKIGKPNNLKVLEPKKGEPIWQWLLEAYLINIVIT